MADAPKRKPVPLSERGALITGAASGVGTVGKPDAAKGELPVAYIQPSADARDSLGFSGVSLMFSRFTSAQMVPANAGAGP